MRKTEEKGKKMEKKKRVTRNSKEKSKRVKNESHFDIYFESN